MHTDPASYVVKVFTPGEPPPGLSYLGQVALSHSNYSTVTTDSCPTPAFWSQLLIINLVVLIEYLIQQALTPAYNFPSQGPCLNLSVSGTPELRIRNP